MFQGLTAHVRVLGEDGFDVDMIILCNFFPPGGFKLVTDSLIEQKHLFVRGVIDKFNDLLGGVEVTIEDDFSAEKLRQEAENRRLRSRRRISGKEVPELQTQAVTEDAEEGERYAEKISE